MSDTKPPIEPPEFMRLAEFEPIDPVPTPGQSLVWALAMLGIGALVHGWLLGPTFDVHSVWSWGYVIAWPVVLVVMLLYLFLIGLGIAFGIMMVTLAVFWIWGWWAERSIIRRKTRELMAKAGAEQQKREAERREMAVTARAQAQREATAQNISPDDREEWVIQRTRILFNQAQRDRDAAAAAAQQG